MDEGNNVISFVSPSSFDKALKSERIFFTSDSLTLLDSKWCFGQVPKNRLTDLLWNTWRGNKIYFATDDVGDIFENWMKNDIVAKRKFISF